MAAKATPAKTVYPLAFRVLREQVMKKKILPIYFLCGKDRFAIDKATETICSLVMPEVYSEFDRYNLIATEMSLSTIMSSVLTPPMGGGKTLVIIKEFDKLKGDKKKEDKKKEFFKPLEQYIASPQPDTVVIIIGGENKPSGSLDYVKLLVEKGYLFEAKEQTDEELAEWVCDYARRAGKKINFEDAKIFVEITGTNRLILEEQVKKAAMFVGEETSIPVDVLIAQTASMREYTVFHFMDALARKQKKKCFVILNGLLAQDDAEFQLLSMCNKFFYTLLLRHDKGPDMSDDLVKKMMGYYYGNFVSSARYYSLPQIKRIAAALLEADTRLKLGGDALTVLSVLLSEIFAD